jgi:CheY-like chemotaxis protein
MTFENRKLPVYYRCPDCGKVADGRDEVLGNPGVSMPCCGATGKARPLWPWQPILQLLEAAGGQDLALCGGFATAVLFLSHAIDLLLRGIIIESLRQAGKQDEEIDAFLAGGQDAAELLARYCAHHPLEKIFTAAGVPAFQEKLTVLLRLSRKLLKDKGYIPNQIEKELVRFFLDRCLPACALLHNTLLATAPPSKTVLVVDDEIAVLDYMARLVSRQGFNAVTAATGREALELYRKQRPDCTFLDVALPDMDGMEILRQIREFDPAAVVYLVTGIGGDIFLNEAKSKGARGYLPKPVDIAALLEALNAL